MSDNSSVYKLLQSWQTRLLRLHHGIFGSQLHCDLLIVDVIYSEGVLLRDSVEDRILKYEALSYTWGEAHPVKSIVCNGIDFDITQNLFLALQHIRLQDKPRYLWVDAICINQRDDPEKSVQVQNMLAIYMKAQRVIGWLGMEGELTDMTLDLTKTREAERVEKEGHGQEIAKALAVSDFYKALQDLYERPWFQRIWVQQEIFAARDLMILCGKQVIDCQSLITRPSGLWKSIGSSRKVLDGRTFTDQRLSSLNDVHESKLRGFLTWVSRDARPVYDQHGHLRNREPPELIETLLNTRKLKATDPRDHVYGILNLTNTTSRAMSIQDSVQQEENVMPIDYSASLLEVYRSMTMYILKRDMNLDILANFVTGHLYPKDSTPEQFPSWVVDWRRSEHIASSDSTPIPSEVKLFCNDNRDPQQANRLFLRGVIESDLVVKKGRVRRRDEVRLRFKYNYFEASLSLESDVVVRFSMSHWPCTLRPTSTGEFEIIEFFQVRHYQPPIDRKGNERWDYVSESEGSVVGGEEEWTFYTKSRGDTRQFIIV